MDVMNQYIMGCPECNMCHGMHSPLSLKEKEYQCSSNPMHKYIQDNNGFLKSV
ncbi:MAG: hypothetical protein ACP5N9_05905 [Candidatus Bilamarchaeum sp.]